MNKHANQSVAVSFARTAKRNSQRRRGVTAVEFALTVPLLFLLIFGAYELSRANMMKHTTEAACYEGARLGIITGAQAADCEAACRDMLATAGIGEAEIQIEPADLSTRSDLINVTITVDYAKNSTFAPFFMRNSKLQRTCELTREERLRAN